MEMFYSEEVQEGKRDVGLLEKAVLPALGKTFGQFSEKISRF